MCSLTRHCELDLFKLLFFSQQVLHSLTMGEEGKDVFGFFISPHSSSRSFTAVLVAGTLWKAVPAPLTAPHQAPLWGFAKAVKDH